MRRGEQLGSNRMPEVLESFADPDRERMAVLSESNIGSQVDVILFAHIKAHAGPARGQKVVRAKHLAATRKYFPDPAKAHNPKPPR